MCHALAAKNLDACNLALLAKGRRQISSVASGDFLQRMTTNRLVRLCSSVTPSPHVRLKVTLGDDIQLLFPIHFNVFL